MNQIDIAKSIIEYGNCGGVNCYKQNSFRSQIADCPLVDQECSEETIVEHATQWLQENGESEEPNNPSFEATNSPGVDGDPGEGCFRAEKPKKFGDLDPQEQEVIRKAYAEGRCEFKNYDGIWRPVEMAVGPVGPFNDDVYRVKEPQHQSDGESEEQPDEIGSVTGAAEGSMKVVYEKIVSLDRGREEDLVNHPPHYTSHPSGVECIEVTRHMGFNLGNVLKYVWRADLKGKAIEDLEKAQFYLADEIQRREHLETEEK